MEQVRIVTTSRWLQVVQREGANFFAAQVKLVRDPIRRHACMWSYRESSVAVVSNIPALFLATGYLLELCSVWFFWEVVPWGRRQRAAGPWNPPTPEVRRTGGCRGSILRALRAKRALPRGCGQMRHVEDAWVLFGGFTKQNEGFSRLGWF